MSAQELLRELMKRDGDNPNSLAAKLNQKTKQPQIYKFLEGVAKEPKRATLQPVATHYGVSVEAFYDHKIAAQILKNLRAGRPLGKVATTTLKSKGDELVIPQFKGVSVPVLANVASMGSGSELHDGDIVTGALTLSPKWIGETLRPSRPDALRFIHGEGDSMTPTFNSGDVLLVDSGITEVKAQGIFVLESDGRMFVKRVSIRMDGTFEVSSDNPAVKTVGTLNGDHAITVLGRVVWVWNGRKM